MKLEDYNLGDCILIEDQETGFLVYNKKTKQEQIIPRPKFFHGQYVKTSTKHCSQKDFTRVISPCYTANRGWVYGEYYTDIWGNPGGTGHWEEEDLFEPLTDPFLKLVAERLNHLETIRNSKTIIKQMEEFVSKIDYSLDIIKPNWQNK